MRRAAGLGMYSNLITSGVLLDAARLHALADAGLDHVQLSFQDVEPGNADRIGGFAGGHAEKLAVARRVRAAGLPLTLNFVVHRQNLDRVAEMIALGATLDAGRVEIAHVQYYGWALVNRAALLPTRAQLDAATEVVEAARARLRGRMVIDYVVPDYYAMRPKACMGGWGRRFINVTPAGRALPCHAAESLPGLAFPAVRETPLAAIWQDAPAFVRFRGTDWMPRAVPVVRPARDRLGRLPLPGFRPDRRCRPDRPGLRDVARPRNDDRRRRGERRAATGLRLSPPPARHGAGPATGHAATGGRRANTMIAGMTATDCTVAADILALRQIRRVVRRGSRHAHDKEGRVHAGGCRALRRRLRSRSDRPLLCQQPEHLA